MPSRTDRRDDLVAGRRPVLELLKSDRSLDQILIAAGARMTGPIGEIRRRAERSSIPVRIVPRQQIEKIAAGVNHQGVVAFTTRFRYTPLDRLLSSPAPALLFLDGVTDPHNVGSLLRSVDAAGFTGMILPSRRSAGVTATVRKVSAGASEVVPVARVTNLSTALEQAKRAGLWVVGLDAADGEDLWTTELMEPPLGLVLGAEGKGISPGVKNHCDGFVRIASLGRLASLNVAVAGAIAMFEVVRRRDASATL